MRLALTLIFILGLSLPALAKTDYDEAQDRFAETLIQTLKEQLNEAKVEIAGLNKDNKDLIKKNSALEVKVNWLMVFAGTLLGSIATWFFKEGGLSRMKEAVGKRLGKAVIILIITGCGLLVGGLNQGYCLSCQDITCFDDYYDCQKPHGCTYCDSHRGIESSLRCQ